MLGEVNKAESMYTSHLLHLVSPYKEVVNVRLPVIYEKLYDFHEDSLWVDSRATGTTVPLHATGSLLAILAHSWKLQWS